MCRSRGGIPQKEYDNLSKFGVIQNVGEDENCGVYTVVEGLLNYLIAVTIEVIF